MSWLVAPTPDAPPAATSPLVPPFESPYPVRPLSSDGPFPATGPLVSSADGCALNGDILYISSMRLTCIPVLSIITPAPRALWPPVEIRDDLYVTSLEEPLPAWSTPGSCGHHSMRRRCVFHFNTGGLAPSMRGTRPSLRSRPCHSVLNVSSGWGWAPLLFLVGTGKVTPRSSLTAPCSRVRGDRRFLPVIVDGLLTHVLTRARSVSQWVSRPPPSCMEETKRTAANANRRQLTIHSPLFRVLISPRVSRLQIAERGCRQTGRANNCF